MTYSSTLILATALPLTITWLPVSLLGLRRIGFIRTSGSRRQAWACTTWARPISPPSLVTNELSDIFWDLKGATDTPSWRRIRHSAAVRTDLPALEHVPWNIREGAFVLVMRVNRSGRFVIVVALKLFVFFVFSVVILLMFFQTSPSSG